MTQLPWLAKFGGVGRLERLALGAEPDRAVVLHLGVGEGRRGDVDVREERLERPRVHHRAGHVVRAAHLALLDDGHGDLAERLQQLRLVGQELQEPAGAGQAGGAAAHDGDADLDALVLGVRRRGDELLDDVDRGGNSDGATPPLWEAAMPGP